MKKTYIVPKMGVMIVHTAEMLAASITRVDGDAGLTIGDGEAPGEANSNGLAFGKTFWED